MESGRSHALADRRNRDGTTRQCARLPPCRPTSWPVRKWCAGQQVKQLTSHAACSSFESGILPHPQSQPPSNTTQPVPSSLTRAGQISTSKQQRFITEWTRTSTTRRLRPICPYIIEYPQTTLTTSGRPQRSFTWSTRSVRTATCSDVGQRTEIMNTKRRISA
jgi:hypothetical protein